MSNNNNNNEQRSEMPRGPHGGMKIVQKPKNFKKSIVKLLGYIKKFLPIIIIALTLEVIGVIFVLIGPSKIQDITQIIQDGLISGIDIKAVESIVFVLIVLYVLNALFGYLQAFIMNIVTQRIAKRMRSEVSTKINKLPLKYLDSTSSGDVLSRVTNDIDVIASTLKDGVSTLISSIVLLVGSILMMFITNYIMAFSAIASSFVGFVLMIIIMKSSQKYFKQQQVSLGKLNGHIEEIYSGHEIVKVYNGEKLTKDQFTTINNELYNSAWKSQFLSGLMMPIMNFVGNLGYVVVCVVGAVLTINGHINFSVIVAFMIYIRLFTRPLAQIAQTFNKLQSTAAASERVFEFLDEKELEDESYKDSVIETVKGNVEFKHVKFGYDKDKIIINDFNAAIKSGQKVAIVGPTGAGKTTIVNLLMRFYEVNQGEILIDGVPIQNMKRESVHDLFSMVLQDTWLFEGTVKENISYSKKDATCAEIKSAAEVCGIHHFIKTLPKGYDTVLDDNTSISAGQKQLLTIARAMVKDSPMLILDEATSSVDTRTEILIQQAMEKLTMGRTSFVIAHRLSTIKNSNLILAMKEGDIVEMGNHEQLIRQNGFYADLYNSQFEDRE